MPTITANGITMNYEQQGSGEPLVLIPYLAADHACYAFQVAEYAKHFTCISVDPEPKICESFQNDLKKIGVELEIKTLANSTVIADAGTHIGGGFKTVGRTLKRRTFDSRVMSASARPMPR